LIEATRVLTILWLGACAVYDVRTGEVPNWLTMPPIFAGLGLSAYWGWLNLGIALGLIALLFMVYSAGQIGGADAKIFMALAGLWPVCLLGAAIGISLWTVGRRLLGDQGRFRAGLPIFLSALGVMGIDSLSGFL
jgi:Flp pilus assembly protein protease CpaA